MSQENFWEKVGSIGKAIQKGYKGLSAITGDEVFEKLENLQVKKAQYTDEKKVEKIIDKSMDTFYENKICNRMSCTVV